MSYTVDQSTGDIVIKGFEGGIGASPYAGLTDAKSVNLSSIPGEAPINFSLASVAPPIFINAIVTSATTSASGLLIYFTGANGLENGMTIIFSATTIGGLSANTPYWVLNCSNTNGVGSCNLCSVYNQLTGIAYSTGGTGTFSSLTMGYPKHIVKGKNSSGNYNYFLQDVNGRIWTNNKTTPSGYWEYFGNTTLTNALGNGLVYYEVSDGTTTIGYLFAFRLSVIDYVQTTDSSGNFTWTYGWTPSGSNLDGSSTIHQAMVAPNQRVYFCNGSSIVHFYQTSPTTIFNPATPATYTTNSFPLLPYTDKATYLAPLGSNILIGGQKNIVYVWDTISNQTNPLFLPENNVASMTTVNTNAYIFCGNRGNIYITNGTQVSFFSKIPDHLSLTVEPVFTFTCSTYNKNRLYFGFYVTDTLANPLNNYTGVWVLDPNSGAIYLAHQLSHGSYNIGYVTAISSGLGNGDNIIAGFYDGQNGNAGGRLDVATANPYTNGASYIISDAIPVGTLFKPTTPAQVEFKLSKPLLVGETIELKVAPSLFGTFTSALVVNGDGSLLSGNSVSFPIQEIQWLYVKAILTGQTSSPSFNRLTELRVIGATKAMTGISNIE